MAKLLKCDACPTSMSPEKMMHIQFFSQLRDETLIKWGHGIKGLECNYGLDVCPDCFNKVLEVLNVDKRLNEQVT